jgi:fibronectin type 3 domain-containing protein
MWADITDSTHGLVAIKNAVDAINFTAIDNKLGAYNPGDTVASLLYDIKIAVSAINWADVQAILSKVTNIENEIYLAPSELKFDFGTATSLWEHDYIQVTETTAYSADTGYGWTNTTGLYSRDRGAPDYTRRDFVFSPLNRTFQVDLPNGNYTVIITMGDQNYAHDNMQIYAEGTFKANVTTPAATYKQIVFTVTVTDGSLELTFVDAGGVDVNWVINSLIIQRNWK